MLLSYKSLRTLLVCGAALLGMATTTNATTYFFTVSGGTIPAASGPGYGSVEITTVGADLKFDVEINSPNWLVDTGNATVHAPVAFQLATSGLQISTTAGFFTALPAPFSQSSGVKNSGFNTAVNYAIACSSNGANGCNQTTSLIFYVLGAGALSPILTDGVYVTADIFAGNVPDPDHPEQLGATGTVGAIACLNCEITPHAETPLPGAVWLFGTVLAGGAGYGRWRKKRKAQLAA